MTGEATAILTGGGDGGISSGAPPGDEQQQRPSSGGNGASPIGAPEWLAGADPELVEYHSKRGSGWKSPADVLKSYRELEAKSTWSDAIRLPKEDGDPAWNDVWKKLGRPDSPDGYGLKAADGDDGKLAQALSHVFHNAGLTPKQAGMLHDWLHTTATEQEQEDREGRFHTNRTEHEKLKGEWGRDYDQKVELGRRAARAMNMSAEDLSKIEDVLGTRFVFEKLASAGRWLREDAGAGMVAASAGFGTPESAQARIGSLNQDKEFMKKLYDGDPNAKDEWDRLFKAAYPG